jgi:hypothetical protein
MSRTKSETSAHEPCFNGGKDVVRAIPSRLDNIMFELVQHGKLIMQCAYCFWIGERVPAP